METWALAAAASSGIAIKYECHGRLLAEEASAAIVLVAREGRCDEPWAGQGCESVRGSQCRYKYLEYYARVQAAGEDPMAPLHPERSSRRKSLCARLMARLGALELGLMEPCRGRGSPCMARGRLVNNTIAVRDPDRKS